MNAVSRLGRDPAIAHWTKLGQDPAYETAASELWMDISMKDGATDHVFVGQYSQLPGHEADDIQLSSPFTGGHIKWDQLGPMTDNIIQSSNVKYLNTGVGNFGPISRVGLTPGVDYCNPGF
ncbi:MAG: hypothetical protein ACI8P0_006410 [Planctomycetaceae bacterium]|jgi:hypothetical protein